MARWWCAIALLALSAVASPSVSRADSTACCAGDCNGDGTVTIDELITIINIALGNAELGSCGCLPDCGNILILCPFWPVLLNNAFYGCP